MTQQEAAALTMILDPLAWRAFADWIEEFPELHTYAQEYASTWRTRADYVQPIFEYFDTFMCPKIGVLDAEFVELPRGWYMIPRWTQNSVMLDYLHHDSKRKRITGFYRPSRESVPIPIVEDAPWGYFRLARKQIQDDAWLRKKLIAIADDLAARPIPEGVPAN